MLGFPSNFPSIKVVSLSEMPFTTLGHWREPEPGVFEVLVLNMPDWRYTLAILFHELVEWAVCQRDGVSTEFCDKFDEWFEEQYREGKRALEEEAGCDRNCPYHKGHMWGIKAERFLCFLLRFSWKEYVQVCQEAIDKMWYEKEFKHA